MFALARRSADLAATPSWLCPVSIFVRAENELADTLGCPAVGLSRRDTIDATQALGSALHGFVTQETSGRFGLLLDIGRDFEPFVRGFVAAKSGLIAEPTKTSGRT